jgi:hypothetical protein
MSKRYGLSGVSGNVELSKGGARVKNSSGVVEHRNNADDAYAVVRGADAVGSSDLVTKSQMDALDVSAAIKFEKVAIAYDDSSPVNIGDAIPNGGTVIGFMVNVSEVFDGTTPTLDLGESGDTDNIAAAAQIDLETVGLYAGDAWVEYTSETQAIATITVSGASQGAATVLIKYIP